VNSTGYLLAGQITEKERLQLQSQVWEPSGRRLLETIDPQPSGGNSVQALDVGCGVLGWLRLLSERVGPDGTVTGTDIDEAMLAAAAAFVTEEALGNVRLVNDDLFASRLPPASFDLVHARFEMTPLGRGPVQLATYLRLLRPGGTVVLEDPDWASWHFNPPAPALEKLVELTVEAFRRWGDAEAGRNNPTLLHSVGIEPRVRADVLALPAMHPYLRLPLQMLAGLEPRLREFIDPTELERLRRQAEAELAEPRRWGTTFTLLQCWGKKNG
jgi:ubiquinone/menaquinone biosynthesis C-methylase UbiE